MGKGLMWLATLAVAAAALCGGCKAAVYKVGDSIGWTVMNSPNYTAWAESKEFHVGDVLVFEYNKQFHNVLEVSKNDYKSCVASSPIATYTSGNDSITLKRGGHHYFLCGITGHCAGGQKVDIRIVKASSAAPSLSPTASPSSSPAPSTAGGSGAISAPTPSSPKSNAAGLPSAFIFVAIVATVSAGFMMH